MIRTTTSRLIIRDWLDADQDAYAKLAADPEVMKYIGDGSPHSKETAIAYIKDCQLHNQTHGYSRFVVELKNANRFIGFCGYKQMDLGLDFGWRYAKKHWGNGYATEAALAVYKYGINVLKLPQINCIVSPENIASKRIIERLNLPYKGKMKHLNLEVLHYQWLSGYKE